MKYSQTNDIEQSHSSSLSFNDTNNERSISQLTNTHKVIATTSKTLLSLQNTSKEEEFKEVGQNSDQYSLRQKTNLDNQQKRASSTSTQLIPYNQGGYHSDFSAQNFQTAQKQSKDVDTSKSSFDKVNKRPFGRPMNAIGRANQCVRPPRLPDQGGLTSSGTSQSFHALTQKHVQQRANSNYERQTPIDQSARGEQATLTTSSQLFNGGGGAAGRNKLFPGSFSTWSSSEDDHNFSVSSQNGLSSLSQFEFRSNAVDTSSAFENEKLIKSPRLSPLQTIDSMIKDSSKKINSEFPFSNRKSRKYKLGRSRLIDFPECIEEDRREEEEMMPEYRRPSRYSEMRDHNEFGGNKHKRYKSEEKKRKKQHMQRLHIPAQFDNIANVWETDEEDIGSDSSLQNKKKVKVMSLGHLSRLLNKKIFSDDFDKSSDIKMKSKHWRDELSAIEGPIDEDNESENENGNYLSDSSSNSQFSLQRRQLSFHLSAFIDRLDLNDNDSQIASKYYSKINDTIEEEIDDNEELPEHTRLSSQSSSQRNNHSRLANRTPRGLSESFTFMNLPRIKINRSTRSICSETINETLEEYLAPEKDFRQQDPRQHHFKVPGRSRGDSGSSSSQQEFRLERHDSIKSLPTILEAPSERNKKNYVQSLIGPISESDDNKSSSTDDQAKVLYNIASD